MGVMQDVEAGSVVAVVPGYGQQFGRILVAVPPEAVAKAESQEQVVAEHVKPGRRHVVGHSASSCLID